MLPRTHVPAVPSSVVIMPHVLRSGVGKRLFKYPRTWYTFTVVDTHSYPLVHRETSRVDLNKLSQVPSIRRQAFSQTPLLLSVRPNFSSAASAVIKFDPSQISLYVLMPALCNCEAWSLENPGPIKVRAGQCHRLQPNSSSIFDGEVNVRSDKSFFHSTTMRFHTSDPLWHWWFGSVK